VIGQFHTQAEIILSEELAVPDGQWLGGPQRHSGSGDQCGTVGKLNG